MGEREINKCIIEKNRHLVYERCMYIENLAGESGKNVRGPERRRETMGENLRGIFKDQEESASLRKDEGSMPLIPPVLSLIKTTITTQTLGPVPQDAFEHMKKCNPSNRNQVRGLKSQKIMVNSFIDMSETAWVAKRPLF